MTIFRTALAAVAVAACFGAQAGPSSHTFGWTSVSGSAVLTLNGGMNIVASNRGWVDSTGSNNFGGAGGNYIAGVCGSSDACVGGDENHRNYFAFDLANASAIGSAVLNLYQPSNADIGYPGATGFLAPAPLTYTLWDVLLNPTTDSGLALFNDLGSGTSFGSVVVDASTNGTTVMIAFNAAGLNMLEQAARNGGMAYVGGAVNAVPEPSTYAMMIAGLAGLGFAARRRKA